MLCGRWKLAHLSYLQAMPLINRLPNDSAWHWNLHTQPLHPAGWFGSLPINRTSLRMFWQLRLGHWCMPPTPPPPLHFHEARRHVEWSWPRRQSEATRHGSVWKINKTEISSPPLPPFGWVVVAVGHTNVKDACGQLFASRFGWDVFLYGLLGFECVIFIALVLRSLMTTTTTTTTTMARCRFIAKLWPVHLDLSVFHRTLHFDLPSRDE